MRRAVSFHVYLCSENFADGGAVNVSAVHAAGQFTEIYRTGQPRGVPRQLESQVNTHSFPQ